MVHPTRPAVKGAESSAGSVVEDVVIDGVGWVAGDAMSLVTDLSASHQHELLVWYEIRELDSTGGYSPVPVEHEEYPTKVV